MEKDYKTVLMEKELERQNNSSASDWSFSKDDVQRVDKYNETVVFEKRKSVKHQILHILHHKLHLIGKQPVSTSRKTVTRYIDSEETKDTKLDLAYIKEHRKI